MISKDISKDISRDIIRLVINKASVFERGLWRATSRDNRDDVNDHEWRLYEAMKPSEKLKFLCRIAILIAENPQIYSKDKILKTNLRKMARGVFANNLIAAFTLSCLLRVIDLSDPTLSEAELLEIKKFQKIKAESSDALGIYSNK